MPASLSVNEHYVIPPSPHVGSVLSFDVFNSGPVTEDHVPAWMPVAVSKKHTQLPQEVKLGDVTQMVGSFFWKGLVFTRADLKNEFAKLMIEGAIGPAVGMIPGLNLAASVGMHIAGDEVLDALTAPRKYNERPLYQFAAIPYLNIVDVDWREVKSLWSGTIRHLTVEYTLRNMEKALYTLVAPRLDFWVKQLFIGRYYSEIVAERSAVMNMYLPDGDPGVQAVLDAFGEKHPDAASAAPEDLKAFLVDFSKAREKAIAESGVTEEQITKTAKERSLALLERYRGLPECDETMARLSSR